MIISCWLGAQDIPSLERTFSVDVECVATGRGHNDRSPVWVAMVDCHGTCVLNIQIAVENVFSYLTPVTGVRAGDIRDTVPLDEALARVHAALGPDVRLVGQSPKSDIDWLKLEQGTHYKDVVDLAQVFKYVDPYRQNRISMFSLMHEASVLLEANPEDAHDPEVDARWSMELYKRYALPGLEKERAKASQMLAAIRPPKSVAKQLNYNCDGVCMAKFYKAKCFCGQP